MLHIALGPYVHQQVDQQGSEAGATGRLPQAAKASKRARLSQIAQKGQRKKNVVRDFPLEIHVSELMRELEENKIRVSKRCD